MKYFKSFFGILFLVISILSSVFTSEARDEDLVQSCISEYKEKTKCDAVSMVVYRDENMYYYGSKDDYYQIGSMTKAFTGLGIEKLIQEGKISRKDKVEEYLPGFEMYFEGQKADIRILDLLSQTSGFTNSERDYPSAEENMTLSQWVTTISGKELQFKPGTKYSYSNVNYNLLGAIIETVSGISYKEYMEQEILIPLGLEQTFVGMPPKEKSIVKGTRLGYWNVYDFEMPVKEGAIPAGYFYSNLSDMGRWMEIWLGKADIPSEYKELIEKTKECLKQEGDYYSGWECFPDGVIGHSGGTANYSSRIVYSPEKEVGVCVLTNVNVSASTDRLCNDVFSRMTGAQPAGFTYDIWTIFDDIFGVVTILGMVLLFIVGKLKNIRTMLGVDLAVSVLLISISLVMPILFQASLGSILFVWAPWSVLGGLLALLLDFLVINIKIWMWKRNEMHNKERATQPGGLQG